MRWTGHPRGELAVGGRERHPPQSGRRDLGAQPSGCQPDRVRVAFHQDCRLLVRDLERHARPSDRASAADAHRDHILGGRCQVDRDGRGVQMRAAVFDAPRQCRDRHRARGGRDIECLRRIGRGNARRSSQ